MKAASATRNPAIFRDICIMSVSRSVARPEAGDEPPHANAGESPQSYPEITMGMKHVAPAGVLLATVTFLGA
ncbi:hypothetical protein, partial [Planomonospora parontospora]|uniref:hypothetical protein n=1 Tax=Planomonospora parontospora TaxID=58119 RepID=UPI001942EC7B